VGKALVFAELMAIRRYRGTCTCRSAGWKTGRLTREWQV